MRGGASSEVEAGLMLEQGNRFFVNRWQSPFGTTWETRARDSLSSSDFIAITQTPGGGFDATSHPDFSPQGQPIKFGAYFLGLRFPTSMFSAEAGVDNWRVDIRFVPEPTTLALGSVALLALAALRRRK